MAALSDEMLMAYADKALDDKDARLVEAAMATDTMVRERVAMYRRSAERIRASLEPLGREPVPDTLAAGVLAAAARIVPDPAAPARPADIVPFRARIRTGTWPSRGMAQAASLALAVGLGAGYGLATRTADRDGDGDSGLRTPLLALPRVAQAIATVPSGDETIVGSARFRAIATFRVDGGGLCREFEVDHPDRSNVVAVACRADDGWDVTFTVASAATDAGYAPVSSLDALQGYLDAIGAAPPLEPAEEAEALKALR